MNTSIVSKVSNFQLQTMLVMDFKALLYIHKMHAGYFSKYIILETIPVHMLSILIQIKRRTVLLWYVYASNFHFTCISLTPFWKYVKNTEFTYY